MPLDLGAKLLGSLNDKFFTHFFTFGVTIVLLMAGEIWPVCGRRSIGIGEHGTDLLSLVVAVVGTNPWASSPWRRSSVLRLHKDADVEAWASELREEIGLAVVSLGFSLLVWLWSRLRRLRVILRGRGAQASGISSLAAPSSVGWSLMVGGGSKEEGVGESMALEEDAGSNGDGWEEETAAAGGGSGWEVSTGGGGAASAGDESRWL